jgi:hypothetical protein
MHDQVDPAEGLLGSRHDASPAAGSGDVDDEQRGPWNAFNRQFGDGRVFRRAVHRAAVVDHQHAGAQQRQRLGDSEPDASSRTGDYRPPVV